MKTSTIKLLKVLTILAVMALPPLNTSFQKGKYVYANMSPSHGTVIAYALNVRESADKSSKIIGLVHQGDSLEILSTKNNWDEIKLSNNQIGWVYNAYLATEKPNATVEAFVLRVRQDSSLFSKVVGKLKLGTRITVLGEQKGWAKIVSPSGVEGWVYEYYITKDTPSEAHPVTGTSTPKTATGDLAGQSDAKENKGSQQPLNSDMQTLSIPNSVRNEPLPLRGKTIVLDPGHGGIDGGTTSIAGTHEKSLTLPTAQAVEQKLKNEGANVILTRTEDSYISLEQRTELSNQNHADAFISFHYNWSDDPAINGVTDFYYQKLNNPLASDILNEVSKTTGLKNDGTKFDDLYVLRNNSQPSTLIELGFLSNNQDDQMVENPAFRDNMAQGVYLGLLDYFQSKNN